MSYSKKNQTELIPTRFQSAYSPKIKTSITFPQNSKYTKQSFKDECDINTIMAQYQRTGEMPNINQQSPQYLDATGYDFREQMEFVRGAKELFEQLPSNLRNRFQNDPARFLDFTSDPINRVEAARLGLLNPEATASILKPPATPVASPSIGSPEGSSAA
nr:MAG: internal scaffolding protein [Microvirus sp.]